MNQLNIAYFCEGKTDHRFLKILIRRIYERMLMESDQLIEVQEPIHFGKSTKSIVKEKAQEVEGYWLVAIHVDADTRGLERTYRECIEPLLPLLNTTEQPVIPIIPVRMTESWMLADTDLLREEIQTNKSDKELKWTRKPENISDPKEYIENGIQIAIRGTSNKVKLGELYSPIAQRIKIDKLRRLPSFEKFYQEARTSLIQLNLIQQT